MCFILKVDEPFFFFSIHIDRNYDGAGINLIGFFLILQFSFGFQFLHGKKCQIHQTDEFVISSFVQDFSVCQILFIRFYNRLFIVTVFEGYFLKLCREGGVTAMVRPVSIQHTDLCHGRISLLFVFKIILDMFEIFECHSQIQGSIQLFQCCLFHIDKSVEDFYICRFFKLCYQCFRFYHSGLTGIYRVDAVILDCFKFFVGNSSLDYISGCRFDDRLLVLFQELYTLYGRIRSLIKLTRQIFYGKYSCSFYHRDLLFIQHVYRRLGEYACTCFLEHLI